MKKMIKVCALIIGLLVPFHASADANSLLSMTVTGEKSFRLVLKDDAQNITIKLTDQQGYTLYTEHVEGPISYNRVFNVSSLPSGEYQLEMDYPTKYQLVPVEVRSDEVLIQNDQMEEYFKPIVRQKGERVSVSFFNTQRGTLNVQVYHSNTNELLSSENLKKDLVMGKQYDFSKVEPGDYLIRMACNNRRFTQKVTIEE